MKLTTTKYHREERVDGFLSAVELLLVVWVGVVEEGVEIGHSLDSTSHQLELSHWLTAKKYNFQVLGVPHVATTLWAIFWYRNRSWHGFDIIQFNLVLDEIRTHASRIR